MSTLKDFDKLKEQLTSDFTWPANYMFKFIIETDNEKLTLIQSKFSSDDKISTKQSSNGKYVSISIVSYMTSADAVINKYMEMNGIKGLISL